MNPINAKSTLYHFRSDLKLLVSEEPIRILYITDNGKFVTNKFVEVFNVNNRDDYNNIYENDIILVNYTDEQLSEVLKKLTEYDSLYPQIDIASRIISEIENDYSDRKGLKHAWSRIETKEKNKLRFKWSKDISQMLNNENNSTEITNYIIHELCQFDNWSNEWKDIDEEIINEIIEDWKTIVKNVLIK
jgi:hypothetical protein